MDMGASAGWLGVSMGMARQAARGQSIAALYQPPSSPTADLVLTVNVHYSRRGRTCT